MIDLTIATWITLGAMALMLILWIGFISYETNREINEAKSRTRYKENRCVMCDATIPEGRQVCPNCERGYVNERRT